MARSIPIKSQPDLKPRCIYKIQRDGAVAQSECGALATHRAARNALVTLCEMHAHEVGRRFHVIPLKDGYCAFYPDRKRR
jgi:hypothetical protein